MPFSNPASFGLLPNNSNCIMVSVSPFNLIADSNLRQCVSGHLPVLYSGTVPLSEQSR